MASSEVEICNLAISWLAAEAIISLDQDGIAKLFEANYDSLRDAVLEDRAWTFANKRARLVKMSEVPVWGWSSQFLLPGDCLRVLYVTDRADATSEQVNTFKWAKEGNNIFANADAIYIKYTRRVTDVTLFSSGFVQSLAQRLASDLAIPVTESRELQQQYWALYNEKIDNATATDGSQGKNERFRYSKLTHRR